MKKLIFVAVIGLAMAAMSCTGSNENNANGSDSTQTAATTQMDPAAWPWDFPMNTGEQFTDGELVLAPYTYYKAAIDKGEDLTEKGLIFYNTNLVKAGAEKSVVNYKEDYELPNSLIIGIPEGVTAKKGDVLLTWWQSGSGLKRAIVRDDSNPAQPKVDYLDMKLDPGSKVNFADDHANEELKPNSFIVLHDGQWEPGAQLACKDKRGRWLAAKLIKATDDKVLVLGFSDRVEVYPKSDCKLIPLSDEGIKAGDKVYGLFVAEYQPDYTVEKVDTERGRVFVTNNMGKQEYLSILEVTKVLN